MAIFSGGPLFAPSVPKNSSALFIYPANIYHVLRIDQVLFWGSRHAAEKRTQNSRPHDIIPCHGLPSVLGREEDSGCPLRASELPVGVYGCARPQDPQAPAGMRWEAGRRQPLASS